MTESMVKNVGKEFESYLRDESRLVGEAETISFPVTESDIKEILTTVRKSGLTLTVQGARTGITAGAVPSGGNILNLSRMNRITGIRYDKEQDTFFISVQPGVILSELRTSIARKFFETSGWSNESLAALDVFREYEPCFFPPDPTETSASVGGMVACNASGACSFYYGPTRKHIESLRVILADGSGLHLRRGMQRADKRSFRFSTDSGRQIEGNLPAYNMPYVKNASGFYSSDDMDMIDLFIGSEGTLGVITEIELRLLMAPASIWGMTAFFPSEEGALKFVRTVKSQLSKPDGVNTGASLAAIEYFNNNALNLLREQKKTNHTFNEIPSMPFDYHTAIYTEYHGYNDDAVCDMIMEATGLLISCGGSEDATWIAANSREMERLHFFRHAVPEAVNLIIDERRRLNPGLTKLSSDMAVPDAELEFIINLYNSKLEEADIESVMFGHIGSNHVHVNIFPTCIEDYDKGKQIYLEWAREVIRIGGTVSAEHGIGKLKIALLKEMYGKEGIDQMQLVKRVFDPGCILNRGNLFKIC